MNNDKLIFALTTDSAFGNLIEPFVVTLTAKGFRSYTFRKVDHTTIKDYDIVTNEAEKKILILFEEFNVNTLQQLFSIKSLKNDTASLEKINSSIRPYIEDRLLKIVELIKEHKLRFFFKGKKDAPIIEENEIIINDAFSDIEFNFHKTEKETHYFITAAFKGEKFVFFKKDFKIITKKPALILIENYLHRFDETLDAQKILPFFSKEFIVIPKQTENIYYSTFIKNTLKKHITNAVGFEINTINDNPMPFIKFEVDTSSQIQLGLYFKYNNLCVLPNSPEKCFIEFNNNNDKCFFEKRNRQFNFEKNILELLQLKGFDFKESKLTFPKKEINVVSEKLNQIKAVLDLHHIEVDKTNSFKCVCV